MTETDALGVATETGAHPEATVDAVTKIHVALPCTPVRARVAEAGHDLAGEVPVH